jgi:PhnB protein
MKPITPYLFFSGNCAEAMRFYQKTLGGNIDMLMTFAEAPPGQVPLGSDPTYIMYSHLTAGELTLMASDGMPEAKPEGMQYFALSLNFDAVDEAKKAFEALSVGGAVSMPLGPTFWSQAFAMLTDRFGTPWMINGPAAPKG